MTLRQLMTSFPSEDACKEYLFAHRWPDGVPRCPRCSKSETVYNINQPWKWECSNPECRSGNAYRFSITAGTIFENTKYPLRIWFEVLYTILNSKKGVSAKQIERQIGSSYPTAWYMCHRLRASMHDAEFQQLMGIVEVDETYIGGKNKNRHWDKKTRGRGGLGSFDRFVRKMVSGNVNLVATDESLGYEHLTALGYEHQVVNHAANEYVRGEIHTQNLDSFWALLKRGIIGTYHHVSKKYLPLYLAEFQFRHNNRREADIFGKAIEGA
jgi:hypothetical protein